MASFNQVFIMGHLGKDPEIRYAQNTNKKFANYSIANSRKVGDTQITDWFDVTCFDKVADFAEKYLHKGTPILVIGELQTQTWVDKASGKSRSKVVVKANRHVFVGKQGEAEGQTSNLDGFSTNFSADEIADLPFV